MIITYKLTATGLLQDQAKVCGCFFKSGATRVTRSGAPNVLAETY